MNFSSKKILKTLVSLTKLFCHPYGRYSLLIFPLFVIQIKTVCSYPQSLPHAPSRIRLEYEFMKWK